MSTSFLPGADQADINRGPQILGATVSVTILALISVCARLFVRIKMIHSTGPDDYVIMLAMAVSLVGIGIVIPEVMNGAGRHVAYVDPAVAKVGLKLNFITQPLYLWNITIVKCSIGLFLLRIAPTRFYRRLLCGTMIFLICYTFASFMTIVLQCKNLAINWDPSVKTTCWTPHTLRSLSYASSSINILTDLMMAFLPVPMLWNVQINPRVKASLICIMGLGVFACAASLVKLSTIPNYGKTGDFLWDGTPITIWTIVECNVGIVTACLPCLKPLFKRVLEKSSWGYTNSKGRSKGTNDHKLQSLPKYSNSATASRLATSKSMFEELSSRKGDDLEDNRSEETILPLQGHTITKTTVVTIDREVGAAGPHDEGWGRRNVKQEFAPERRVEDRF